MEVQLLGSVEAHVNGRSVAIGAGKPRALFALLALRAGTVVSSDRLIEGLWGDEPPASATKLVQLHVSQLRKALAEAGDGEAILTRGHGYELRLGPDDVDARRFERMVAGGSPREALGLWHGPALDDVSSEPFAAAEIRRLDELRLLARERAIDRDLADGRHREVVSELEGLVLEEPLREKFHAQRMLALYRSGRQADALEAYRQARRTLIEEIGVEPGPELRELHQAILQQDASLEQSRDRAGEAAARLANGRAAVRVAEDDLAADIAALQSATPPGADVVTCPFKGLASFDIEDAEFFFGREGLVAELVARLTGAPLTGIIGASGSGKSSVLRAGLLPALSAGVLPGSASWAQALLRPGEHPQRALEQAIDEASPTGRLVIAVDQFEETFVACRDEGERRAFVDTLVASARDPRRRTLVLLAIRADFYDRCARYPELARLLSASHVLVGPMRRDELRRAIELPARRAGLEVEPALTDALLAGVEGEPGALPLLSTSLLELWQRRDGRTLRLADHEAAGGVRGAVARLAEQAYERLDPGQSELARRILLRLAGEGEGDAVVRRQVPLAELGDSEAVAEILAVLADGRLVTVSEDTVEVAHEALLREWPRLRSWLDEDAQGRHVRHHLTHAADDWQAAGRDPAELYRGARLASALDWSAEHPDEPNDLEHEFLAASRQEAERESERQRATNRRLRVLLLGVAAMLALAVAAGVVALSQRGAARDAALSADAQRLGSDAVPRDHLDEAMLLARAGIDLEESASTRSSLLSVLLRSPAALGVLPGDGWPSYSAAMSPDMKLAAVGDERGIVTIFDLPARRRARRYMPADGAFPQYLAFSPDNATLAVTATVPDRPENEIVVDLVDARTGKRQRRIELDPEPGMHGLVVGAAIFSPNGRTVTIQQTADGTPAALRRVDAETGAARGGPVRVPGVQGLSATADGRRLLVTSEADKRTTLLDARSLRVVARFPVGGEAGAVSGDGRLAAIGSSRGDLRLLDLRSGRAQPLEGKHEAGIQRVAFADHDRTLVTSASDGKVALWDVGGRAQSDTLPGHERADMYGLQIASDGVTALTGAADGRAILWDVGGDRRIDRPFDAGEPFVSDRERYPRGLAVSADGRTLAQTQSDGTVDLVDTRTLRVLRSARAIPNAPALAVDFSPDGRLLAVVGEGGQLKLLDARTLRPVGRLTGMTTPSQTVAFSPDGAFVAAAELGSPQVAANDGMVRTWDVRRRAPTGVRFGLVASVVAYSPDGRLLAAAALGGERDVKGTEVHDARTGKLVVRLRTGDHARSVAFSPDGRLVATGDFAGDTQLWSTASWKPIGQPMHAQTTRIQTVAFTPDGRTLATAAADGSVHLWDVATQRAIGTKVTVEPGSYMSAAFTPQGSELFAVGEQGRGMRLNVSVEVWKRRACAVAGRPMTPSEWRDAAPGREYRPVCPKAR